MFIIEDQVVGLLGSILEQQGLTAFLLTVMIIFMQRDHNAMLKKNCEMVYFIERMCEKALDSRRHE